MQIIRPFGPIIGKDTLPESIHEKLILTTDKILADPDRIDLSSELAGMVKDQNKVDLQLLDKDVHFYFMESIYNYMESVFVSNPQLMENIKINIETCWVNNMVKHDSNPPHVHSSDLSAIIVLKLPDHLKHSDANLSAPDKHGLLFFSNNASRLSHEYEIGNMSFKPFEGDFFLFPARLTHTVIPFSNDGERRTMSFNVTLNK